MRQIKFRGLCTDCKEHCGDLIHGINDEIYIKPFDSEIKYQVINENVCQLVGYDKNGTEVYEGDPLINKTGSCGCPAPGFALQLFPGLRLAR